MSINNLRRPLNKSGRPSRRRRPATDHLGHLHLRNAPSEGRPRPVDKSVSGTPFLSCQSSPVESETATRPCRSVRVPATQPKRSDQLAGKSSCSGALFSARLIIEIVSSISVRLEVVFVVLVAAPLERVPDLKNSKS